MSGILNLFTLDSILGKNTKENDDSKVKDESSLATQFKHSINLEESSSAGNLEQIKSSLIELENQLWKNQSILMNKDLRFEWIQTVKGANSINDLKPLLLKLVESIPSQVMNPIWPNKHEHVWKNALKQASEESQIARLILSLEWLRFTTGGKNMSNSWGSGARRDWRRPLELIDELSLEKVKRTLAKAWVFADVKLDDAGAGHRCISPTERDEASADGSALLFGELLIAGVHRALDAEHLNGYDAKVLYDLGMGLGKMAMQAYLFFPNLQKVVGVELARSRFILGKEALKRLAQQLPEIFNLVKDEPDCTSIIDTKGRTLEFRKQNLFDCTDASEGDIVICETHIPKTAYPRLGQFMSTMKPESRTLCFENLSNVYSVISDDNMPYLPLHINVDREDRFKTTWSRESGHHFYLFQKKSD